jgi:hypothetical protein
VWKNVHNYNQNKVLSPASKVSCVASIRLKATYLMRVYKMHEDGQLTGTGE